MDCRENPTEGQRDALLRHPGRSVPSVPAGPLGSDRAAEVNDPAGRPGFSPKPTRGLLIPRSFGACRNTAKRRSTLLSVSAHSLTMHSMATAAAASDTRPAISGSPNSWIPKRLRRLTPEEFAELIVTAGQRDLWWCHSAGRRGGAFSLRADTARRARLLFEPAQAAENGPVVLLGATEIALCDLCEDTLPRWCAHLAARRNPAPEDAAFLRRLFVVLRLS